MVSWDGSISDIRECDYHKLCFVNVTKDCYWSRQLPVRVGRAQGHLCNVCSMCSHLMLWRAQDVHPSFVSRGLTSSRSRRIPIYWRRNFRVFQLLKAGSRQDRCRSRRAIACFPHVFDFEKIETHRTRLHGSRLNVYCSPFVAYDPSPDDIGTVQLKS